MIKNYFNNCLTSQPAPQVIEAMLPYMKDKFFFPANFVLEASEIEEDINGFKSIIAKTINAKPSEIHFTTGGTSANNIAIKGYISANYKKGNHIICSVVDYPDLLTNAAFFEKSGFKVTYLKVNEEGFIDLNQLEKAITPKTILFMTTIANHTIGTIQPVKKIREILDKNSTHRIAIHIDACEAYARMPIDVKNLDIDLMSVSAHKIHGPKGIGFLYQKTGTKLAQVKHGINRLDQHETGGFSIAAMAGFAKAVELAFDNLEENIKKIKDLRDYLLNKIETEIPYTLLNGPRGKNRVSHNLNISFDYIEGEAIMMMLDLAKIYVDTGSACASKGLKPNYVQMAIGRTHEQSHGSLKFTLTRYHTKEEIDYTVQKLKEIVTELRRRSPLYDKEL